MRVGLGSSQENRSVVTLRPTSCVQITPGYRNRAQTGQLNPLFHNFVDLMNRVGAWQNTDWSESNSFFSATDRQTRLKALSSRTMLSHVTILTTAVPSVSYNDPFYVVFLFQIHEPPVYTTGWGSAMRTVRICSDPCVKVTIICSGKKFCRHTRWITFSFDITVNITQILY